jgi:hypothetical protein
MYSRRDSGAYSEAYTEGDGLTLLGGPGDGDVLLDEAPYYDDRAGMGDLQEEEEDFVAPEDPQFTPRIGFHHLMDEHKDDQVRAAGCWDGMGVGGRGGASHTTCVRGLGFFSWALVRNSLLCTLPCVHVLFAGRVCVWSVCVCVSVRGLVCVQSRRP